MIDRPPPPSSLLEIAERVERRIDALLVEEAARWSVVDPALGDPIACLRDLLLSGGKRLRPAFCHWAYVGAGGADSALITDVGAALELLHGFALIHDDVMDGSDRRRGQPTAHTSFDDRHRAEAWRGESRRFGEGVAILVGDLAFVYADMLLAPLAPESRRVWDELRIELNIGQYLDLLGTARGDADVATARRIATYKSGKYTVERPLHLGAAMAGRLDDLAGPLTAYGLPLGEAFQLRDDLLGAFGDSEAIGKPVGDDLREGKPTPLLAIARERATGAGAAVLQRVGDPTLGAEGVAAVQEVLVATGAVEEVEHRIATLTDEAVAVAKELAVEEEAQVELVDLATYVAWRDR
ncbi:MAG: geranylgeranyl pyrophosphate synthase [Actinomycetia bacterium]|nr:geranylgeranyl pyrophosphate synthase [Actinomycetes bacterium]